MENKFGSLLCLTYSGLVIEHQKYMQELNVL